MDLLRVEKELKQRWNYPYNWGRKQNDNWDRDTNFIYKTHTFQSLLEQTKDCSSQLKAYAMNRWYNYWSAKAAEAIFVANTCVVANKNTFDKLEDFRIKDIPFDHKTTVFPREFTQPYEQAVLNKMALIEWLYRHQSQQGRQHFENRIFIVLYDSVTRQHWKMKAEIELLKKSIDAYLQNFSRAQLQELRFDKGNVLTDILWIKK